jgi:hypothetical protein
MAGIGLGTAQGGKKWLEAARRLDAQREQEARPIAQPRPAAAEPQHGANGA